MGVGDRARDIVSSPSLRTASLHGQGSTKEAFVEERGTSREITCDLRTRRERQRTRYDATRGFYSACRLQICRSTTQLIKCGKFFVPLFRLMPSLLQLAYLAFRVRLLFFSCDREFKP